MAMGLPREPHFFFLARSSSPCERAQMFKLFRRNEIKGFAEDLAGHLAKRYSADVDRQPGKRPSVNRLTRVMEETCQRALEYQRQQRLGWLGKARLSNEFRWALKERGYSQEFISFATEAIVVYLSRNRAGGAGPGKDRKTGPH